MADMSYPEGGTHAPPPGGVRIYPSVPVSSLFSISDNDCCIRCLLLVSNFLYILFGTSYRNCWMLCVEQKINGLVEIQNRRIKGKNFKDL